MFVKTLAFLAFLAIASFLLLLDEWPLSFLWTRIGMSGAFFVPVRPIHLRDTMTPTTTFRQDMSSPHLPNQPTPLTYSFNILKNTTIQPKFCSLVDKWAKPKLTTRDTLLQVEIPKTATTSFQVLLRTTCHQTSLKPKPLGRCKSLRCCRPKMKCNWFHPALVEAEMCAVEDYGLNATRFYPITILRNPVMRTISEYREWTKNWPKSPNYAPDLDALREKISLLDFINHPHNPANNRQLWMITPVARGKLKKSKDYTSFYTFWKNYYKDENFVSRLNNDKELLELTKSYLANNFAFFGITEYYNLSVKLFLYTFNAAGKLNLGRYLNKSSVDVPAFIGGNSTVLNAVLERNKADMELYNFAVELFKERVTQMQKCMGEPPIDFSNPDAI